jgi:ubiquinone/menaquinone biosynthesis C-methylase UbiE
VGLFSLHDLPDRVAEAMECRPGMATLDLGCGPGKLPRALLGLHPQLRAAGIDPDRRMLGEAARNNAGNRAGWVQGLAQALPFPDASLDRVSATFMLHHLTGEQKRGALAEAWRALKPGGELHVVDWTKPRGLVWVGFLLVRLLDGFEPTADHAAGRLPELVRQAGFERFHAFSERNIAVGRVLHFRAEKPGPA